MVRTFGIVNVTRDSFSDGGRFFGPGAGLARARELLAEGADVVDLGAESTHPEAEDVLPAEQVSRLEGIVGSLVAEGADVSIDSWRPEVWEALLPLGIGWINCVRGFRGERALDVASAAPPKTRFVVMFSRGEGGRAGRPSAGADGILDELRAFFGERIAAFERRGVDRRRLVLDPGMGFFLGREAAPSLRVLRSLEALRAFGVPLMISVSRKSLIGEVTGRSVSARGPGTLAAELWGAREGAEWVRTHDVAAFRDAWAVERAIAEAM